MMSRSDVILGLIVLKDFLIFHFREISMISDGVPLNSYIDFKCKECLFRQSIDVEFTFLRSDYIYNVVILLAFQSLTDMLQSQL